MFSSPTVGRWAHRAGLAGAAAWWLYAFYSTRFFTSLTGTGVVVYLVGVVVVYALAHYAVKGAAWVLHQL